MGKFPSGRSRPRVFFDFAPLDPLGWSLDSVVSIFAPSVSLAHLSKEKRLDLYRTAIEIGFLRSVVSVPTAGAPRATCWLPGLWARALFGRSGIRGATVLRFLAFRGGLGSPEER